MKKVKGLFLVLAVAALTACNSNDDGVQAGIEIPGITITDDIDCCSAEEALQVYNFLQTVKIIPELSTVVDGQYNVFAYTTTGSFHNGYNEIFFVAVFNFHLIRSWKPHLSRIELMGKDVDGLGGGDAINGSGDNRITFSKRADFAGLIDARDGRSTGRPSNGAFGILGRGA